MGVNIKNSLIVFGILSLSLLQISYAQGQYESTDYANPGSQMLMSKSDGIDLLDYDFDTTGTGVDWDFSDIASYSQRWMSVQTPASSGIIYNLKI